MHVKLVNKKRIIANTTQLFQLNIGYNAIQKYYNKKILISIATETDIVYEYVNI